jgi:hypothetical protein
MEDESVRSIKREINAAELRLVGIVYGLFHPHYWWLALGLILAGALLSDSARWTRRNNGKTT